MDRRLFPAADSTEPRDEDLDLKSPEKVKFVETQWWVGIVCIVIVLALTILAGALFGLGRAVGFWMYVALTGDRP
jgi:hypothetical protein